MGTTISQDPRERLIATLDTALTVITWHRDRLKLGAPLDADTSSELHDAASLLTAACVN
jgi:hypothetical protein